MKLARAFNVFEADRRLTVKLGLLHFLVAAAHSLFDIGSTSLLIARVGPNALPQVYLGSAVVLILVGLFIIPLVDRLDRSRLMSVLLLLFAALVLLVPPIAERSPDVVYRFLYIACYLMKSLLFLQFWLLAGDLLDIRQAKRLFPVLLGFSLMGGVSASIVASLTTSRVSTESLLSAAGMLLIAGILPVQLVSSRWRNRFPKRERAPRLGDVVQNLRRDIRVALHSELLRTFSVCLLLLALLAQVLDFLMGKAAHANFTLAGGTIDTEGLTAFYALLNAIVIGAGTFVQFFIANRFVSSMGVTRGLLVAPLALLGAFLATGAVWMGSGGQMATGVFAVIVASRAIQRILRISIVRTSSDLVFNAIPAERRGRAKAFKDTLIEPLGVLLSGLLLMLGTTLPLSYILGGSLILAVAFLVLTVRLKDDYLESLVHVLKERSRFRFAFPSMVMRAVKNQHSDGVAGLRHALQDDEASVRLLAVEVAAGLKEPEAASILIERFREEDDSEVRAEMLAALGKMVHKPDEGFEAESTGADDPTVRATDLSSMAQSGIFRAEELLGHTRVDVDRTPESPPSPESQSIEKTSMRERFHELATSGEQKALERLVHYMEEGDGATRHLASRALESCGDGAIDVLTLALWSTDVEGRRYVIRALSRIGTERARQALLPVLSLEAEEAYYELLRLEALKRFPSSPGLTLLSDSLAQRVERSKLNVHQILRSAFMGQPGMRLILSNLNHPDRYVRSSAIEALEVRVDPTLLGNVLPLFEHESPRAMAEHGSTYFELPVRRPREVLEELTRHRAPWVRACAIYAVGELGDDDCLRALEDRLSDDYELARLNAIEAIGKLGDRESLNVLERLAAGASTRADDYAESAMSRIRARV